MKLADYPITLASKITVETRYKTSSIYFKFDFP